MSDCTEIKEALVKFRNDRDWAQFHDTKNLAVALSIEAAELNELFLWKEIKDSEAVEKEKIKEELASVIIINSLGQILYQLELNDTNGRSIVLSNLPKGIYYLMNSRAQNQLVEKIVEAE